MDQARNFTLENGIGKSGGQNLNYFMKKTVKRYQNATIMVFETCARVILYCIYVNVLSLPIFMFRGF